MIATGQDSAATTLALLESACVRNLPIELHYEQRSGMLICLRSRLLLLDPAGGRIIIDTPSAVSGSAEIPGNVPFSVHMMLEGRRWEFRTSLLERSVITQLNASTRVRGCALALPPSIVEAQRRSSYRLAIAGEAMPVAIVPAARTPAPACPVDGPVIVGRLVNISAGGAAVLIEGRKEELFKRSARFFLRLPLVGDRARGTYDMMGEVRHVTIVGQDKSVRLGIAFSPWAGVEYRTQQQGITRFIAEYERKMIRKRNGT